MAKTGIYIHIPFCARKCPYCDFYSVCYREDTAKLYTGALLCQLSIFERRAADTIYFGGGTPSIVEPHEIFRMIEFIAQRMDLDKDSEITLELNPETATKAKLLDLKVAGINRLSIGVQTTADHLLQRIGRQHTAQQAFAAIRAAHDAGFQNISADLMLALPGDSVSSLTRSLKDICSLPVSHISAYLLKIMSGTKFGEFPPTNIPDDDTQAELYEMACGILSDYGFAQYEISNFARPGFESRHNLKYWNCEDYIGLGAAAHSSVGGKRYSFARDIQLFIDFYSDQHPPNQPMLNLQYEGDVTAQDYIMLQLRMVHGLSFNKLYKLYNYHFDQQKVDTLRRYAAQGLLTMTSDTVALTTRGMLVSNAILASIL